MQTYHDICSIISNQHKIVELLQLVELQNLPDAWIGAGLIRNAVWDYLHGFETVIEDANDVDVVYFDNSNTSEVRDQKIEKNLKSHYPRIAWEVTNQARMHQQNCDPSYKNTEDAMRYWPETATAIAARTVNGRIEILTPFGIEDLINLIIRPNPVFESKHLPFEVRLQSKGWTKRWPKLRIISN